MRFIRSLIFLLGMTISTCLWVIPCILARLLPYHICFAIVSSWCTFNVRWAKFTCGIHYEISGLENIPEKACVIMSNHQSTWETLAYPSIFPTLTWVIKKELLYVPLFGWGIASTQPIALDRKQGKKSFIQLIKDGKDKLNLGRFIIIFPEGTRIPYDEERPLKIGGFVLAKKSNTYILPVAHDAGRLWPRNGFLKSPGTIHLHIGKPFPTQDQTAEQLRERYATWLKETRAQLKLKLVN
ncbi:MAG: lysophospholipid acyltransferase family protein [Gammaproteobacteria bacterium]|nr:lysophospholipid acyltransferase family protein [Gammaproteobacteria bacterium]